MANTKHTEKLWIEEIIDDNFYIEDDLKTIVSQLNSILEIYPTAFFHKQYYGYDGGYDLKIKYRRQETDEEYKERCNKEEISRQHKMKDKQAKIEKLKKQLQELENSK